MATNTKFLRCSTFLVTIVLTSLYVTQVNSGVSSFRVYDENRILQRLAETPVSVSMTMSHRMGEPTTSSGTSAATPASMTVRQRMTQRLPQSTSTTTTTGSPISSSTVIGPDGKRRPVRQQIENGRRRIRKVVKKVRLPPAEWNTEFENEGEPTNRWSSTPPTTDLLGNYERNDAGQFHSSPLYSTTQKLSTTEANKIPKTVTDKEDLELALQGVTKVESVKESSSSPLEEDSYINFNTEDVQLYQKGLRHSSPVPYEPEQTDLQIGESSNPFVNSSTPIISDFENNHNGGLQYKIQILHPLLNSDSVLSHKNPKLPENKRIRINHNLSEELGEIPFAPDLRSTFRVRKKQHPLLNQDSIISTDSKISKNNGQFHHEVVPGSRRKLSSQIKQFGSSTEGVTFVEAEDPQNPKTSSTTYPAVTAQRSTTRQSKISTSIPTTTPSTVSTTRRRPTIRLTNPTTTTSQRPSTVILSPVTYTVSTTTPRAETFKPETFKPETPQPINPERESQLGSPQVILFPPEGTDIIAQNQNPGQSNKPLQVPTPLSTEQDILNQLFGLGQSTPQAAHPGGPENNIFDLLNYFQAQQTSTEAATTPRPTTLASTTTRRRTTTATTTTPLPPVTPSIQTEAELENLLQLAILDGLLKANGGKGVEGQKSTGKPANLQAAIDGLSDNDLKSIYSLIDNQGKTSPKPVPPKQQPPPSPPPQQQQNFIQQQQHHPPQPATTANPLQAALSSMLSIFTNPFGQQQKQPQQQTNIFGQPQQQTNIFGQPQQSIFGQNLFGQQPQQQQRPGSGLFGGNSLFNFNLNSDATTTTSAIHPVYNPPSTTVKPNSIQGPAPSVAGSTQESDSELFNQLLQLGIAVDQQGKQNNAVRSTPQPPLIHQQQQPKQPALDLQSILSGNWLGGLGTTVPPPRQTESAPSETMQLLNILFNQNKPQQQQQKRTTGPYWWMDMNAFFGGNPTSDPMAGIRPKFGQRDYFIKVQR